MGFKFNAIGPPFDIDNDSGALSIDYDDIITVMANDKLLEFNTMQDIALILVNDNGNVVTRS